MIVIAVWMAVGVAALRDSPDVNSTSGVACGSGDWPAFMLSIRAPDSRETPGWILWCNEANWTMHVVTQIADAQSSRRASGVVDAVFPWFDPTLQPEEAFRRFTGSDSLRSVEPRNHQAVLALTTRTLAGQFRMEFTEEGIPIVARSPGETGYRFVGDISRSDRPVRSNEEPMGWPPCSVEVQRSSTIGPHRCWVDSGVAPGASGCLRSLESLTDTSEFKHASCSF